MNCEIILSSDEEDAVEAINKVHSDCFTSSAVPLKKLQIHLPFSNKNGLQALNSYRNGEGQLWPKSVTIVDVRSLAGETPSTSKGKGNFKTQHQTRQGMKGRISSIESIEESIEACVQAHALPEAGDLECVYQSGGIDEKDPLCTEIDASETTPTIIDFHVDCSIGITTPSQGAVLSSDTAKVDSQNSIFFSEFITKCLSLEDNEADRRKAQDKLRTYHAKARKEFVESSQFAEVLAVQMAILTRETLYTCIRDVLDTLKLNKQLRRVPLQAAASTSQSQTLDDKVVDTSSTNQSTDCLLKIDVANTKDREKVAKLQSTLETLKRKIQVLEEAEVNLDDEEDSSYLKMQRYRERFSKIYAELSRLTKVPKYANRASKRKIRFNGTKYPEVNVLIERWLNKNGTFPDFTDIVDVLKGLDMGFTLIKLHNVAEDAFLAIGKHLQKRRKRELWDILGEQYPMDSDPAMQDPSLSSKLEENRQRFHKQEQEIFDKFVEKQLAKQENANPDSEPDADSETDAARTNDDGMSSDDSLKESLKEGSDSKSDIENIASGGVSGSAASMEPPAKAPRLMPPESYDKTPTVMGSHADEPTSEQVIDKDCVIQLNFFTVQHHFSIHVFCSIFRNCLRKGSCLQKLNGLNRNSKTIVKWGHSWKWKQQVPIKKELVFKFLRQAWNELTKSRHGAVTNGTSSPPQTTSDNSNGSSHSNSPEQTTEQVSPPNGGASGDDGDDDDEKRRNHQANNCKDKGPDNVEEEEVENETDETDKDLPEQEEQQNETEEAEEGLAEKKEENGEDSLEKGGKIKEKEETERDFSKKDGQDTSGKNTGGAVLAKLEKPVKDSENREDGEPVNVKEEVSDNDGMRLRIRNSNNWKPKWIDNGEESENSSSDEPEERDSNSDPDFSPTEGKKVKRVLKSLDMSDSNSTDSVSKSKDKVNVPEAVSVTPLLEDSRVTEREENSKESKKSATGSKIAEEEEGDDDDIEVISENIVKKPETVTPQDRVSSFLANASKFDITVTRKRPMSRETKEALTQLKKMKNINISSSRQEKAEVMVINDGSRGEPSGLQRRHSTHGFTHPNLSMSTPGSANRFRTAASVSPSARQVSRPRLPVISNVQSFRHTSPVITGVRGAGGSRLQMPNRGRVMPMPRMGPRAVVRSAWQAGTAAVRRGLPPRGPRPVILRPNSTRAPTPSTRSRGGRMHSRGRGMPPVPRPRPPATSVPFVLLD